MRAEASNHRLVLVLFIACCIGFLVLCEHVQNTVVVAAGETAEKN